MRDFFNPNVTKTVHCATCREIVIFKREKCWQCGIALDHKELAYEAEINQKLTQAISVANSVSSFNIAIILYVYYAVALYVYGVDYVFQTMALIYGGIIGIIGMIPPYLTFKWLSIYGALPRMDSEYVYKKLKLIIFLYLWGMAHIINFCVMATHIISLRT